MSILDPHTGTRVAFSFYGDAQLERVILGVAHAAADARPAWEQIGDSLARAQRRQFNSEGAYGGGGRWQDLSPSYARWKARHYPGKGILEREGDLKRGWTQRPFPTDIVTPRFAIFAAPRMSEDGRYEVGKAHQTGAGRLPVRKVIDLPESLRRRWVKILQAHLVQNYGNRSVREL